MPIIIDFLRESLNLWLEVSPYLLLGMFIAGLLHVFLGKELISRHLGRGGISSIIKATILGIPLPVCSCGVIPLASSLKKDGAHSSSVLSFLVSTPTTGVDSILATYSLMGPLLAIFRPLGSLLAGIFLGILDYISGGRKEKVRIVPRHNHPSISISFRLRELFRYSFFELPQDIGKWLIVGTILGGAISAFIPKELFSQYVSFPFDFLIALIIGVPLYVCATGSIPVAASLIQKGFSPGAALVFLIAGPATNAITLAFVRAKLGKKSFYLYLVSIIVVSIILGFIFNYLWLGLGKDISLITGAGQMLPLSFKVICGLVLFLLIMYSFPTRKKKLKTADLEIDVPDIHCRHCKITLESKIGEVEGINTVSVSVKEKKIRIQGKVDKEKVLEKIKEAGYTPQLPINNEQ